MKNSGTHILQIIDKKDEEYEQSNHGRWIDTTKKIASISR